ncbi:MAG: hypothetical protein D6776_09000 [Planctomycetota bacterium]|nr:MAG: hypothetical protein D6776_09000 [Planctomycetota bacterium]
MQRRDELDPIEAAGSSPMARARMWQRMQEELERRDAEDAAAAALGAASAAGASPPPPAEPATPDDTQGPDPTAAVAGALAAGLQAAVAPSPLDERLGRLAAIQSEALARLEEQPHAEQVLAGVREAQPTDGNATIATRDELAVRKHERDLTERELQKRPGSPGYAEDHVERGREAEYRDGRERLEDERGRRERRLD